VAAELVEFTPAASFVTGKARTWFQFVSGRVTVWCPYCEEAFFLPRLATVGMGGVVAPAVRCGAVVGCTWRGEVRLVGWQPPAGA
jgi:hypothetical protein